MAQDAVAEVLMDWTGKATVDVEGVVRLRNDGELPLTRERIVAAMG
mgnify:CR=1 FL=1